MGPAVLVAASAVSGINALMSRAARSIVGRAIRWRSVAVREAMGYLSGGRLGAWSRQRSGHPRVCWEGPLRAVATFGSWEAEGLGRPREVACKLVELPEARKVDLPG